jgi:hypothetical protein
MSAFPGKISRSKLALKTPESARKRHLSAAISAVTEVIARVYRQKAMTPYPPLKFCTQVRLSRHSRRNISAGFFKIVCLATSNSVGCLLSPKTRRKARNSVGRSFVAMLSAVLTSFFAGFYSESANCGICRKADLKTNMRYIGPQEYICNTDECADEFLGSDAW